MRAVLLKKNDCQTRDEIVQLDYPLAFGKSDKASVGSLWLLLENLDMDLPPLTDTRARVLGFIRREIRSGGRSPSLREIQAEFGYGSSDTARFHVNNLVEAGYLRRGSGHRGLQLTESTGLRVMGTVAAGSPIEAIEEHGEHIDLGGFSDDDHFALRVRGDSMIEEWIADGDHVVVKKQETCSAGELVVANGPAQRWRIEGNSRGTGVSRVPRGSFRG